MGRAGNEADIALALATGQVIGANGQQASVLTLRAGVGLEGGGRKAGDLAQRLLQALEHLAVALGLIQRDEGVQVAKAGPGDGQHLGRGV